MTPRGSSPARAAGPGASMLALLAAVLAFAVAGGLLGDGIRTSAHLGTAATVFVSVFVQAMPFLVLGVVISGAIGAWVTPERLRRLLPRNPAAAVGVAGVGGVLLPGCECGSVPVARRLMAGGVPRGAALTFLLAAPAVNPVVVVATLVAFPGLPQVALARFAASMVAAVVVGWIWLRVGRADRAFAGLGGVHADHCGADPGGGSRWGVFLATARGDLVTAGSYLVLGAAAVAVFHVVLPAGLARDLGANPVAAVAVAAALAVVLSLCSESDAFVASAMTALPLLPRLVFLVVGPVVDLKLAVLYVGAFGRRFALRFVPVVFGVAVVSALVVGGAVFALTGIPAFGGAAAS